MVKIWKPKYALMKTSCTKHVLDCIYVAIWKHLHNTEEKIIIYAKEIMYSCGGKIEGL